MLSFGYNLKKKIDKAVLENHHVSAVFALLQNDNYNIFAKFNKEDYKNIRERIITVVLATDMSNHFTDIAKLKGRLAAGNYDIFSPSMLIDLRF